MRAGYSGTPLVKKLGIKPGHRLRAAGAPRHYWKLLAGLPDDVVRCGPRHGNLDVVHVFVTRAGDLRRRLPGFRQRIVLNGMIWVSWPKKFSGVESDVTEDVVREVAFANRLVDVKVCAVDEVWSGLKLVIRKADR
jgi:hypothetical protein